MYILQGLNEWAFKKISQQKKAPIQISMDGTRIICIIELYKDKYLVGESFSPDVRKWPKPDDLPTVNQWHTIHDYISAVRTSGKLVAEAHNVTAVDITGLQSDVFLGSIPKAASGVTASYIYSLIMMIEKEAERLNIPIIISYCMDSASNSLAALEKLALPRKHLNALNIKYLALPTDGFIYAAKKGVSYDSVSLLGSLIKDICSKPSK